MSMRHCITAALLMMVAAGLPSCRQTRPVPGYEPMLVMETNSPGYVHNAAAQGSFPVGPGGKKKGGG